MIMSKIVDKAKEESKEIADYLLKNYGGMRIKKAKITLRFGLANNRAILVFNCLEDYGIKNECHSLVIPVTQ